MHYSLFFAAIAQGNILLHPKFSFYPYPLKWNPTLLIFFVFEQDAPNGAL